MSAVSFALGISTVNRGNQSYLKQALNSVVSRMTPSEEKDSVVIVSVADVRMKNKWLSSCPAYGLQISFLRGNHCIVLDFFFLNLKKQFIDAFFG